MSSTSSIVVVYKNGLFFQIYLEYRKPLRPKYQQYTFVYNTHTLAFHTFPLYVGELFSACDIRT